MQPRSARTRQAELHRSSGAKERRHQDDSLFHHLVFGVAEAVLFQVVYRHGEKALALTLTHRGVIGFA